MKIPRVLSGVRFRLFLLVVVVVAPAFGLTLYTASEHRRRVTEDTLRATLAVAQSIATEEDRIIDGARQLLIGLARRPEVQRHDAAGCSALFADVLATFSVYANISAATPDGRVFCSAVPLSGPVSISDRPYFREALETGIAVSEHLVARTSGKASLNVAVRAAGATGSTRGVVFAGVDIASLSRRMAAAPLPEGYVAFVVDRHGTVLTHYPDPDTWSGKRVSDKPIVKLLLSKGQAGTAGAEGLMGHERLFGFTALTMRGAVIGYVAVGIPVEIAFAEPNRILRRNLVSLGVIALVTAGVAWLLAGALIVRPVDALMAVTGRFRAGDLSARVGPRYGTGEMGRLGRALDTMGEALQQRETELERQREALFQSEKLAALGRLAAGVGHELKNPLTVLDARLQMLTEKIPDAEALARNLVTLRESSKRMKSIMAGLSNYAKPVKAEPMVLTVDEVLRGAAELVTYDARKGHVAISVEAPATLPLIRVERSQFTQVLVNLSMNAIEAMAPHGGGQLILRAGVDGDRVRVEIADTGPGIPTEALQTIWQPFYTTKAEGTGLGLSIVRGLVADQPGATIDVRSEVGRGTTFTIRLPAVLEPAEKMGRRSPER